MCVAALGISGCGSASASGHKKVSVSGTVALDGKPLPEGLIYFKTVATGDIDTLNIKDGKFQGPAGAGTRRVEFSVLQSTSVGEGQMKHEIKKDILPPKYNVDSKLSANVDPQGKNEFNFDLQSK